MQLLSVCLGYLDITVYNPYIKANASPTDPANPQKIPSARGLILTALSLTMVEP